MRTLCQPIGIRDVLDYLVAASDRPDDAGIVEIGGPDVLSYAEMMRTYARLRGMRRLMIPVPVLTPRLSSYWCSLVTPIPSGIARPLIEGLRNEVVVRDPGPGRAYGIEPTPFETAVQRAIERRDRHAVETTWFDSLGLPGRKDLSQDESREGMLLDRQRRRVQAPAPVTFAQVERLGGTAGWPFGNWMWRVRGMMDRAVGGPGMRLGRRIRATSASAMRSTSGGSRRSGRTSYCGCAPRCECRAEPGCSTRSSTIAPAAGWYKRPSSSPRA